MVGWLACVMSLHVRYAAVAAGCFRTFFFFSSKKSLQGAPISIITINMLLSLVSRSGRRVGVGWPQRAFSNTRLLADQYDVVVVGTYKEK
jgi:hypothetical protein